MRKSMGIEMQGFEVVEKVAVKGGNSSRIYVPKRWEGKKVRAVLIE
jgi:putative transposon-encoded protein|tara:strand:- start:1305 stop:1442 length:138 start_codon:yes stop_codon:yes gene_type:complete